MDGLTPLALMNRWIMHGSGGALIRSSRSLHVRMIVVHVRGSEKLGV